MTKSLSFNQLHTFYHAANTLSFIHAAKALFVSPSAVSHQIKHLETALGYPVFIRKNKQLSLTQDGARLFNEIKSPVEALLQASRNALSASGQQSLTLSVAPVFASAWLLPHLGEFNQRYPQYSLNIVASTDVMALHATEFDASVRLSAAVPDEQYAYALTNMNLVAVSRPNVIWEEATIIINDALPELWHDWRSAGDVGMDMTSYKQLHVNGNAQVLETLLLTDAVGLVDYKVAQPMLANQQLMQAHDFIWSSHYQYYLISNERMWKTPVFVDFKRWLTSLMP